MESIINKSLAEGERIAKSLGYEFRVVKVNGEELCVEEDLQPMRVNVSVSHPDQVPSDMYDLGVWFDDHRNDEALKIIGYEFY